MKTTIKSIAPILVYLTLLCSCKQSPKPGSISEIKFHVNPVIAKSYSEDYLFDFDSDSSLVKIQSKDESKTEDVVSFKYEKGIVHQLGYTPFDYYLDSLGRITKAIDKDNNRYFTCIYDNDGYLSSIIYFNIVNHENQKYLTQIFRFKNGNLIRIDCDGTGIFKTLCEYSYYSDTKSIDGFIPFKDELFRNKSADNPRINYSAYSLPKGIFGKQSKNLLQSITVPGGIFNGEFETVFEYQFNSGKINRMIVKNNPNSNHTKGTTEIELAYNGEDEGKSNEGKKITEIKPEPLKTLNDIKLTLLDSRLEKADILLGKPDNYGVLNSYAEVNYRVYFNKVLDQGIKKHLVLVINNNENTIMGVEAIKEGDYFYWGLRTLIISKNGLKSNGGDFTIESNTNDNVSAVDNSSTNSTTINNLNELPNPADAVKSNQTYTVKNATLKQVYNWYVQQYKAQLHDNTLNFYVNLDEGDFVAQSTMIQQGGNVILSFKKIDTSAD